VEKERERQRERERERERRKEHKFYIKCQTSASIPDKKIKTE